MLKRGRVLLHDLHRGAGRSRRGQQPIPLMEPEAVRPMARFREERNVNTGEAGEKFTAKRSS
jgi:hypothetical protein